NRRSIEIANPCRLLRSTASKRLDAAFRRLPRLWCCACFANLASVVLSRLAPTDRQRRTRRRAREGAHAQSIQNFDILLALLVILPAASYADPLAHGSIYMVVQSDYQYCMQLTLTNEDTDVFGNTVNLGASVGTIFLTGAASPSNSTFTNHGEGQPDPSTL